MSNFLGIDPGTHRMGWGIINGTPTKPQLVDCGCLEFPPGTKATEYLVGIHNFLQDLLSRHRVDQAGLEKLFAQNNQKTVISVAEARGVILMSLAQAGIVCQEFSPNTIKSVVAGSGSAGKVEVRRMIGLQLGVDPTKLLDDTTDALAVALCAKVTMNHNL